ncbi:MAG: fumarate reductase iron-sulfur subunit [bacterium]|jgi:fumarate reductase iron-sulfur subunit
MNNEIEVSVWRGDENGHYQTFTVPTQKSQTVLDIVAWIQEHQDYSLSYRFACRVGMCGSCAMTVNGIPRWTCRTHINKVVTNNRLEIAPLRNFPIIKDLATDMDVFFDKWIEAEGLHHPSSTRNDPIEKIDPKSKPRMQANAGIECINCAVCYSACDTVSNNPDYLGPAALQRAWTVYNDAKDSDKQQVLRSVSGSGGCHNCHTQGSCSLHCPNDLKPMDAIAGLKRESVKSLFKSGG